MVLRLGKKKVYFPNIIFKIVRSNLPPNQVAFRVPPHVNKLDVRDYLLHIYGVRVTDVRTALFHGKERLFISGSGRASYKRDPSWKKVIVTLEEEFHYPPAPNVKRDFGGDEAELIRKRMSARAKGWKLPASMRTLPSSEKEAVASS
jgi:ribosomal protein L23